MTEERRIVTVLFADVVGSTALGESADPEDVRALLGRFYALAKEAVAAHGGTIEKFIGDAAMAVFGLPLAHGDDAERALAAALALRERVGQDAALRSRIAVRFGVNTGEVVATLDGSAGDFLVTGDPVNVAARLQQAAEPDAILCGERTVLAARAAFAFGPLAAVEAKGKRAAVQAAPLLGRSAARKQIRLPLIGRDSDLAQLELVARRAFEERRPALVSIIAPAGTGKTRLLEEFLDRLPSLAPAATVTTAQCLPYGQRLTYWPLRAVLFRLVGLGEDTEPAEVRDAVRGWLLGSGVEDHERVAELLAATVGAGETEVTDRAALVSAWRTALEAASRRSALVVVFEDLHWSSDSLLDLVEAVMHPRGDAPVLMVALTRPELLDRRPAWGGGRRNYVALSLEPLSDGAIAELVGHLLETHAPDVAARVVARAEGNPFFATELVRSLLDRVTTLGDTAALEHALATLPDTVQATVLARLDLLAPDERRTLQLGAIHGRAFRAAGIVALAPEMVGRVEQVIDALADKDLVRPSGADAFAFRHILIRETAYGTLPRAERSRLHSSAGGWLESTAAGREDAYAELIAYHYREAATLASGLEDEATRAEVRRRAATWLARAAEVALAGAANVEAVRHLRAAVELAAPERLPELHERIGDAHASGEAAESYLTALDLGREIRRPPDQQLRALAGALTVYTRSRGSVATRPSEERLAELRSEGRALLTRAADERAIARFLTAEAFFPYWIVVRRQPTERELAEAEASGRRALEIAERLGNLRLVSAALDGIGSCFALRGQFAESRELARRRTRMGDALDLVERIDAYSMAAWMSVNLGELDDAIATSAAGAAILQPGQAPAWALHLMAWRALALYRGGLWDEALAAAERARLLWIEAGRISAGYATHGLLAALRIAWARRDDQLADRYREVIEEISASFPEGSYHRRYLHLIRRDADLIVERILRAPRLVQPEVVDQAISLLCDLGRPPDTELLREVSGRFANQGSLPLLRAQIARATGLVTGDADQLSAALATFAGCGAVPDAARARYERGALLGDDADRAAALRALEALGDVEQITRYERARA